jgi:hypothetical protein
MRQIIALKKFVKGVIMSKIDFIIDALECALDEERSYLDKCEEALAAARSLRELKPVAWMLPEYGDVLSASEADGTGIYNVPLYTAPPRKEWVGLTDKEIFDADNAGQGLIEFARAIETKLKEKNGAL